MEVVKRTRVVMVDDRDGTEIADGEAVTTTLGIDGQEFELDLSRENRQGLEDALAPWLANARRVGVAKGRRRPRPERVDQLDAMRRWAKAEGMAVSDRGRVSRAVQEAYQASQGRRRRSS